jgi:hypothetical protein
MPCHRRRNAGGSKEFGEVLLKTLDAKLDGYEAILSKQKFLAGNVRSQFMHGLLKQNFYGANFVRK